jgi:hypothetical protein
MSTNKKDIQQTEKVMTKYDLKMQKRAEEKKKDAKTVTIWKFIGVAFVVLLLAFVLSFPARTIYNLKKTVVTIDGEKIGKVEFDYMYNTVKSNYMQQYSAYLSYFGLSEGADLSKTMYSEDLSFQDYFESLAVDQLKQNIGLQKEAAAAGYTHDTTDEWNRFIENAQEQADSSELALSDFLKENYGAYATKSRLQPVVEKTLLLAHFYEEMYESKLPTEEEMESYYQENTANYDAVDYVLTTVNAEMPTEPTELADEGAAVGEDGSYTPSDAEKEAAMDEAKKAADEAEKKVFDEGEEHSRELSSAISYYIKTWLFDDERVEGDTTVIENKTSSLYYVLGFKSRYRIEDPTVDMRIIVTDAGNDAAVLAEWESTEKTEEDFINLVNTFSLDTTTNGGLYTNQDQGTYEGDIKDWLFSADRQKGDVTSFNNGENYSYVIYFVGQGEPAWKASVTSDMMNERMTEYLDGLTENMTVEGDLNYLKVEAAKAQEAEEATEETTEESTEAEETTEETTETEANSDAQ